LHPSHPRGPFACAANSGGRARAPPYRRANRSGSRSSTASRSWSNPGPIPTEGRPGQRKRAPRRGPLYSEGRTASSPAAGPSVLKPSSLPACAALTAPRSKCNTRVRRRFRSPCESVPILPIPTHAFVQGGGSGRWNLSTLARPERSPIRCYIQDRRALSSVGRAPARQAGGHWFEPSSAHPRRMLARPCWRPTPPYLPSPQRRS
jgi:hypothetical protein